MQKREEEDIRWIPMSVQTNSLFLHSLESLFLAQRERERIFYHLRITLCFAIDWSSTILLADRGKIVYSLVGRFLWIFMDHLRKLEFLISYISLFLLFLSNLACFETWLHLNTYLFLRGNFILVFLQNLQKRWAFSNMKIHIIFFSITFLCPFLFIIFSLSHQK